MTKWHQAHQAPKARSSPSPNRSILPAPLPWWKIRSGSMKKPRQMTSLRSQSLVSLLTQAPFQRNFILKIDHVLWERALRGLLLWQALPIWDKRWNLSEARHEAHLHCVNPRNWAPKRVSFRRNRGELMEISDDDVAKTRKSVEKQPETSS